MKGIYFLALFIFFINSLSAQVTKVKHYIKYNADSSTTTVKRYDCHIVVTTGSAISATDRLQGGSQYTVVVPTGSIVELVQKKMPLQNNQTYTGTVPTVWGLANQVFNAGPNYNDFYGIVNNISPSSFYNNLSVNDTIKLFSLNVELPTGACLTSVRPFKNITEPNPDPTSADPSMLGGDFSNGFVLGAVAGGGTSQDYDGNIPGYYGNEKVLNTNNAGIGSLRKAVECAAPESTILFDNAIVNDTIKLQNKIDITKNLKFVQTSTKVVNIKAMQNAPCIEVFTNCNFQLTYVNLFAKNSNNLVGRAIYNNGILTLNNVNIIDPVIGTPNVGSTLKNNGTLILKGFVNIKKN